MHAVWKKWKQQQRVEARHEENNHKPEHMQLLDFVTRMNNRKRDGSEDNRGSTKSINSIKDKEAFTKEIGLECEEICLMKESPFRILQVIMFSYTFRKIVFCQSLYMFGATFNMISMERTYKWQDILGTKIWYSLNHYNYYVHCIVTVSVIIVNSGVNWLSMVLQHTLKIHNDTQGVKQCLKHNVNVTVVWIYLCRYVTDERSGNLVMIFQVLMTLYILISHILGVKHAIQRFINPHILSLLYLWLIWKYWECNILALKSLQII